MWQVFHKSASNNRDADAVFYITRLSNNTFFKGIELYHSLYNSCNGRPNSFFIFQSKNINSNFKTG